MSTTTLFFFLFLRLSVGLSSDLVALLSLKSSLVDPLFTFRNWHHTPTQNSHHALPIWCSWSGVVCDTTTQRVVSLDISSRNLSGSIPVEIRKLDQLVHLNLSHNAFQGQFPTSIFTLQKLQTLDINHNSFNSSFPLGISNLKFLTLLNCYSNSFTSTLPEDLSGENHNHLQILNLGGSYFQGSIPSGYGSFPKLTFLYLAGNNLNGSIPPEIGSLSELRWMEIGYNAQLSGHIPSEFGQLFNLNYIDISNSNISGEIPPELGNLTMLNTLLFFNNRLSGSIPLTISSLKSLQILDFSFNQLVGYIPEGISTLKELTIINLQSNNLTGEIPIGIGDLPTLRILQLWNNRLTGFLPANLGNNGKLEKLDVSTNYLTGALPENLCKDNKLVKLTMFSNLFESELPSSLANCTTLTRVRVHDNLLTGEIPKGFGNLQNLTFLDLSMNNFTGEIPTDLGNSVSLGTLNLSQNSFNSEMPENIWQSPNLQIFSASGSGIIGKLPDFYGCQSIYKIELSGNSLNGTISWKIGDCKKLVSLNLAHNSLTGIIPWELSTLPVITDVDLSHNLLNGTIPSHFDNCTTLEFFNVSYNLLTGPIPSSGSMIMNLHPSSFTGNPGLCGKLIGNPCSGLEQSVETPVPETKLNSGTAILWITAVAFGVGLFVLLAGIRWFRGDSSSGRRFGRDIDPNALPTVGGQWKLLAFQRLNFTADDVLECLAMSDKIIGMGSTGTVYRAEMPGGEIIAVKKLWGKNKETARTARRGSSVLAEVDVLGSVRHRNIVRLLGCCNNRETTMLLYEYMPNGSLDDLLHGRSKCGAPDDWLTRYKIALGVAHGICYLHHDCDPVVVHRDLKPSNILLDADLEARVADFGVSKLIQGDVPMSVIAGSYGYIAPEYAYTLQVDEKSDIYSFGVVLLEILTRKRAVQPEFGDGNSIVDWVRSVIKTKDGIDAILDESAGASCGSVKEEMLLVLRVALICTSRNPADRPSMRDVVSMLHEAMPQRKLAAPALAAGAGDASCRDHVVEINCGGDQSLGTSSSFEQDN